jgi:hypothetical protein
MLEEEPELLDYITGVQEGIKKKGVGNKGLGENTNFSGKRDREEFLSILGEQFPQLSRKRAREILKREELGKEVEPYFSMLAQFLPDVDVKGRDSGIDWRLSRICDELTLRKPPFASKSEQRERTPKAVKLNVNAAYKPKAKKVQPVNRNDGTGGGPGGRADWFERSKARETPQEQEGKYRDYLLPRITSVPKGSRLTPERLQSLDIGDWLWEEEKAMFYELMLNREGAIAFDWKEVTKIHDDISPPILIKTIEHEAWQEKISLVQELWFL